MKRHTFSIHKIYSAKCTPNIFHFVSLNHFITSCLSLVKLHCLHSTLAPSLYLQVYLDIPYSKNESSFDFAIFLLWEYLLFPLWLFFHFTVLYSLGSSFSATFLHSFCSNYFLKKSPMTSFSPVNMFILSFLHFSEFLRCFISLTIFLFDNLSVAAVNILFCPNSSHTLNVEMLPWFCP